MWISGPTAVITNTTIGYMAMTFDPTQELTFTVDFGDGTVIMEKSCNANLTTKSLIILHNYTYTPTPAYYFVNTNALTANGSNYSESFSLEIQVRAGVISCGYAW